jgi:predicted nucleotidyltransferase
MLYGSKARAEDDSSSDIDLLVLLEKPFDYFLELRRMTELLYPLQLESEQMISIKPAAVDEYQAGVLQLYRNAMNEGVTL